MDIRKILYRGSKKMVIGKLNTKMGQLVVERSGFSEEGYPGYFVTLTKDGKDLACVMLEVDESEKACKVHVWDSTQEDPICDMSGRVHGDELELGYIV